MLVQFLCCSSPDYSPTLTPLQTFHNRFLQLFLVCSLLACLLLLGLINDVNNIFAQSIPEMYSSTLVHYGLRVERRRVQAYRCSRCVFYWLFDAPSEASSIWITNFSLSTCYSKYICQQLLQRYYLSILDLSVTISLAWPGRIFNHKPAESSTTSLKRDLVVLGSNTWMIPVIGYWTRRRFYC